MTEIKIYPILVLFAAISSFNIGFYYLIQSVKKKSSSYMALGTIMFSICLFFSYYELVDLSLVYPQIMWINGPLLFTVGPLLYLHVIRKVTWRETLHFIPFLIVLIWILPFYIKSAPEKLEIIKEFYRPAEKPEMELMQYLYVLHIGLYCLFGYLVLRKKSALFDSYSSNDIKQQIIIRSQNLYLLIASLSILSFLVCLISDYFEVYYTDVDNYTISLLVVLILLLQIYFSFEGYDSDIEDQLQNSSNKRKEKSNPSKSDINGYQEIINRLEALMDKEKLFRNPDLKINTVAEKLDISMHELSAAINYHNGDNFFDYINKFRIEELKATLLDKSNKNLTLFAIASESGFKSNSSFYRVFKKYMACTPNQYIKQNKDLI